MPAEGAGIRFGQYMLMRRLARGGMAEVFLAQQQLEGFARRVAIKRILPHLADAPDFIKMFLSEAKLAAQLTHPNIVHIYDFGKVDTDYFIAMELVDGVHAGELFKRSEGDRLSPTMIARIGADAAAALHYAHELRAPNGKPYGLVHRDVSPANLMVTFDGAVKLCDFGIAKAAALGEQLTIPGHVKGKYAYMSPEQTIGAPLDGRSDVYTLAIVLWELVAGVTIVGRGDAIEAMRAIRDGKLTPIDVAAPDTPPALARAINGALSTNRDQRPTALQLAQELEAFIKSSPELGSQLQLGSWLRDRFPREPLDDHDQPSISPGTLAVPTGDAPAEPALVTGDTTSETRALALPDRLADAATVIAGPPRPFDPGATDERDERDDGDGYETSDPDQNDETVMRSNVFRAQLAAASQHPPFARSKPATHPPVIAPPYDPAAPPAVIAPASPIAQTLYDPRASGPAPVSSPIAQTLYDARPSAMRASPIAGVPAIHGPPGPPGPPGSPGPPGPPSAYAPPQLPRRALAIGGLVGLAVLSFVIALATRGSHPGPRFSITPPVDAAAPPDAVARAAPAVPDAAPPPAIDAGSPPDAFVPTIQPEPARPTTVLELRTRPDGATVTIGDRTQTSPAQFVLSAGHYQLDAEHDGWLPEHRELDLTANTRVVQDIVFTHRRPTTHKPTKH
ncbi:MAG TPA: serine/threonine-protein kinase [Kofleriaceae bacterium]